MADPWATPIPYEDIDVHIRELCQAINEFPGLRTAESCSEHPEDHPGRPTRDRWMVNFVVRHGEDGWFALEFLTWLINSDLAKAGGGAFLWPNSFPPSLNEPGAAIYFVLEGAMPQEELAAWIRTTAADLYISPDEVDELEAEDDELA